MHFAAFTVFVCASFVGVSSAQAVNPHVHRGPTSPRLFKNHPSLHGTTHAVVEVDRGLSVEV